MKIKNKSRPEISASRRLYIKKATINRRRVIQERVEEMEQDFEEAMKELNSTYRGERE